MTRYVCVHGHFYQPPRESPWLEAIEPQPSAAPYVDWNARITAECYRPNAQARITDGHGTVLDIVDNYARMSFNVGPTLLDYLSREAPDVHAALLDADAASQRRFGGHGSAMAQGYGHLIMPLASAVDKRTQVRWGIADFRYRFARMPEGMWLAECAVDVDTLEALAEEGIAFTILAPHQAARFRPLGSPGWQTGAIDTSRVYRCQLPSGLSIDLFFYDGPTSRAVAFENLLSNGGRFADRLVKAVPGNGLSHIATDGESYGHHHRFGDMALAFALTSIEAAGLAGRGPTLTNYGQFRELEPATWEVQIVENTAWSCAHGIERWRSDCGCNSGGRPDWNQSWRAPLRRALDWLRDRLAQVFFAEGQTLLRDPWAARDAYINVMLERTDDAVDAWLDDHAREELSDAEEQRARELGEMQRHAMAMYTSCGWFFDDLSGIETVQCLQYAGRAIELAERGPATAMLGEFLDRLSQARSNLPDQGDGRQIFNAKVAPAHVDATDLVAHLAATSLVDRGHLARAPSQRVFAWDVTFVDRMERHSADRRARLVASDVQARSWLTGEQWELSFAGIHRGGHHISGGVEPYPGASSWDGFVAELGTGFDDDDLSGAGAEAAIARHFRGHKVSMSSLLGAGKVRAVDYILRDAIQGVDAALERQYENNTSLLDWLRAEKLPVPATLRELATSVLRRRLHAVVTSASPDFAALQRILDDAEALDISVDTPILANAAGEALVELVARLALNPDDDETLEVATRAAVVAGKIRSPVDLWHAQNLAWQIRKRAGLRWEVAAELGDAAAARRLELLGDLCRALRLRF